MSAEETEFEERPHNTVYITLVLGSDAERILPGARVSRLGIGSLDSLLGGIYQSHGPFIIEKLAEERKYKIVFRGLIIPEIYWIAELMGANEHIESALVPGFVSNP